MGCTNEKNRHIVRTRFYFHTQNQGKVEAKKLISSRGTHITTLNKTYTRLDKKNPSAERPNRLEICIESKAPLWLLAVGLGAPLLVELGTVVMFTHWTSDGIVKVDERVKSMHCTRWDKNELE